MLPILLKWTQMTTCPWGQGGSAAALTFVLSARFFATGFLLAAGRAVFTGPFVLSITFPGFMLYFL